MDGWMDGQLPSGTLARVAHARQHFLERVYGDVAKGKASL